MVQLSDWFSEIVSGWMLIDSFDDITYRIEEIAKYVGDNAVKLNEDEKKTLELMIEVQIARADKEGVGS
jgi:hypothetical protein